jgi:DNA-binding GntR family transcriptional regulator
MASNVSGSLQVEPLHERAAARLRDMVVDGRLAPGEPIDEKELCDEFGISRTPLREALKILAAEGLIELLPRRGAIVTPIVSQQLNEKFELVRLLEDYAVRLVCQRATEAQIEAIQQAYNRVLEHFDHHENNGLKSLAANDQLHQAIVNAAGSRSLLEVHGPLWLHLRRARYLVVNSYDVSRGYVQGLGRLVKAIRARNSAAALREMETRWSIARTALAALATTASVRRSAVSGPVRRRPARRSAT